MNTTVLNTKETELNFDNPLEFSARVSEACQNACNAIAPAWPLDQSIAVNPHWKRVDQPVRQVAARMAVLGEIQVFPPREQVKRAWASGEVSRKHLKKALEQNDLAKTLGLTPFDCIDALDDASAAVVHLPLLIDVLDDDPEKGNRLSWRQAITHQVSQTCAAYFDTQAEWQPDRRNGLYAYWRDSITHDHGIGLLMGLPQLGKSLDKLPMTSEAAEQWVIKRLGLPESVWEDYLEAVLLTVNGWASWCAYLGWQANLSGGTDEHLRELLAIRLAWGAILLECKEDGVVDFSFRLIQRQWQHAQLALKEAEDSLVIDEVWQQALELEYQAKLAQSLLKANTNTQQHHATVQAAFCIDVRSERMRRALETVSPTVQTFGVAGFFGLPIAYQPFATQVNKPQLPGLLAPTIKVSDQMVKPGLTTKQLISKNIKANKARNLRFGNRMQWDSASKWPSAAFSFVEVTGFSYLRKLSKWVKPSTKQRTNDDYTDLPKKYQKIARPTMGPVSLDAQVQMAESILHAMGLKEYFATLVLLVGHGSQSDNNAHAAALDCGACCGQTGEVNARVLAGLMNNPLVRSGLQQKGIHIPKATTFVAALHNTTTDQIECFDEDLFSPEAKAHWDALEPTLNQAGDLVRRERAKALKIDHQQDQATLLTNYLRRANDGAQTRPEYGLANNAAFVIASRERTKGVDLGGRIFLHEYNTSQDTEGALLEQLMTAPMLVTHWINWQYHASTCDQLRMGSGNKLLHNVVGGNLGVYEGNGGDLRIGLSKQSLHDGENWTHDPLRLTVVVDAPLERIEQIVNKHEIVRDLVDNQWLYLWAYAGDTLLQYQYGEWVVVHEVLH